jgi:cytochrome P450
VCSVLQKGEPVVEWLVQCEFFQSIPANKATFEYSGDFSFIPEGTSAFIHTYSLQRDPRYFFPLPDSFLPERWLSQEQRLALEPKIFHSQEEYVHNTDAFIPFSVGPTNCAGKNLAWLEMRIAVTTIVSRFDLKLDPSYNSQKWYEDMSDYFAMIKGPLPTILSPRQSVKV